MVVEERIVEKEVEVTRVVRDTKTGKEKLVRDVETIKTIEYVEKEAKLKFFNYHATHFNKTDENVHTEGGKHDDPLDHEHVENGGQRGTRRGHAGPM